MALYSLEDDTSGLPATYRSGIPYEIDALSPKETWGAGNSSTTLTCRQLWSKSASWIRDMVGQVVINKPGSTPVLSRYLPEELQYEDDRVQFCSIIDQIDQGGNRGNSTGDSEPLLLRQPGSFWPETQWCRYRATFETFPYDVRSDGACDAIVAAAGSYGGARELLRYVIRNRRSYTREQPIPSATTAGGFKVVNDDPLGKRDPIGQVAFRILGMADVTYKWVRVPVCWPAPISWDGAGGGYTPGLWPPRFNPAGVDPTTSKYVRNKIIGYINKDYFDCADPLGYCWNPGELLYTGYDSGTPYWDAAGYRVCDITFNFRFKEGGWNTFLSSRGEWVSVSLDGTSSGTKPYTAANFKFLFQHCPSEADLFIGD
jgi:hypothetical protein